MSQQSKLTRREFIKDAAIAGVAVSASGLLGTIPAAAAPGVPAKWDEETDVLVLGAGIGGLVAAVEASNLGGKVTVLEKMDIIGGTSLQHGGQFIAYGPTSVQKDQKTNLGPEDTKENYYKLLAYGREDVLNLDLVKLVTDHCNEAVEWAIGIGHQFLPMGGTNALPFLASRPWSHNSKDGGYGYAQALKKNLDAKGTKILMKHRVLDLVTNSNDEVVGAKVDADGTTKFFKANKAVVLATGGFSWNPDMIKQFTYRAIGANPYRTRPHETGDGIKMGQAVGADLWGMEWMTIYPGTVKPAPEKFWPPRLPGTTQPPQPTLNIGPATPGIYVTKSGFRFADETLASSYLMNIGTGQEDGVLWAIFDATAIAKNGGKDVSPIFENDIEKEIAAGYVFKADTIQKLAEAIKINNPQNLVAQVDKYNASVAAGKDVEFGKPVANLAAIKQAPFYATPVGKLIVITFGGLRTNTNAEILDPQGKPVARLYGVGRVTGGYMAKWYPTGGATMGEMTIIGRIAAKNALAQKTWV